MGSRGNVRTPRTRRGPACCAASPSAMSSTRCTRASPRWTPGCRARRQRGLHPAGPARAALDPPRRPRRRAGRRAPSVGPGRSPPVEPVHDRVVGVPVPGSDGSAGCGSTWCRPSSTWALVAVLTAVDVTLERHAAAALEAAEHRFRLAAEHAPIGIAIVSLDGSAAREQRGVLPAARLRPRRALRADLPGHHPPRRPRARRRARRGAAGRRGRDLPDGQALPDPQRRPAVGPADRGAGPGHRSARRCTSSR